MKKYLKKQRAVILLSLNVALPYLNINPKLLNILSLTTECGLISFIYANILVNAALFFPLIPYSSKSFFK